MALEEATGSHPVEVIDFMAGTSTGAILSAAVAARIPTARLLDLYLKRAKEVFPQRRWNIVKRVVLGYMYSAKMLNSVLREESGAAAGWSLNDVPIDIMVTGK